MFVADGNANNIHQFDLATGQHRQLLKPGTSVQPCALVHDEINRYVYWTDLQSLAIYETSVTTGKTRKVIDVSDNGKKYTADFLDLVFSSVHKIVHLVETSLLNSCKFDKKKYLVQLASKGAKFNNRRL